MKFRYLILLVAVLAMSCGPKKGIVTKKKRSNTTKTVVVEDKKEVVKTVEPKAPIVKANDTRSTVDV